MTTDSFQTTGTIAARLGVPLHRVEYVIRAKGIRPVARAGAARVFGEEQVDAIAAALRKIEGRKREGSTP